MVLVDSRLRRLRSVTAQTLCSVSAGFGTSYASEHRGARDSMLARDWTIAVTPALILSLVLLPGFFPLGHAPSLNQASSFYFHSQSSKTVNGVTTNLWANTTQFWPSLTQTQNRSAVKGSPAVWQYYTQPRMSGNVSLSGPVTFGVYLASSAKTGGGTVVVGTLSEVLSTGNPVLIANASLAAVVNTNINLFTITTNPSFMQIQKGGILNFTVTVSVPGVIPANIALYYDSPSDNSFVSATFQSRFGIASLNSYNQTGVQTAFYSRNSTAQGRQVTLQANGFDTFGLYDIQGINATVYFPSGMIFMQNAVFTMILGNATTYSGLWDLNFSFSTGDQSGTYDTILDMRDNGGSEVTAQLSIVLTASLDVDLETVTNDPVPVPVPGVAVAIFLAGQPVYTGFSNGTGWVNPGAFLSDNRTYVIIALWEGQIVNQTAMYTPVYTTALPLHLSVYETNFAQVFRDGSGNLLSRPPSAFQLSNPNGTITSPDPSGTYLLPAGSFTVSKVIWQNIDVTPLSPTFDPSLGNALLNLQVYDLTVRVVDQNGQGVSGASVALFFEQAPFSSGITGSNGSLVFHQLPIGTYAVEVSQPVRAASSATVAGTSSVQVQVRITQSASSWAIPTLEWIILAGTILAGLIGYNLVSKKRRTKRIEQRRS